MLANHTHTHARTHVHAQAYAQTDLAIARMLGSVFKGLKIKKERGKSSYTPT